MSSVGSKLGNVNDHSLSVWSPPPQGYIKINCDGAYKESLGSGGVGAILRDHQGGFVGALSKGFNSLFSARQSLLYIMACFLLNNWVSKELFLSQMPEMWSKLACPTHLICLWRETFISDVRELLRSFHSRSISWTKRESNGVAHMLANRASSLSRDNVWMSEPSFLNCILVSDFHQ